MPRVCGVADKARQRRMLVKPAQAGMTSKGKAFEAIDGFASDSSINDNACAGPTAWKSNAFNCSSTVTTAACLSPWSKTSTSPL